MHVIYFGIKRKQYEDYNAADFLCFLALKQKRKYCFLKSADKWKLYIQTHKTTVKSFFF